MFCSDISLNSDISVSQVASLASFYTTPYPIQTGSTAYMLSLNPLHSWDPHTSQSAHKTEFTCRLPQEPLLISPAWDKGFYFLFSISVQIFHQCVLTSMMTAPVIRDCVFSLLDSQHQAHDRNFIYISRAVQLLVGEPIAWQEAVLAPHQCTHTLSPDTTCRGHNTSRGTNWMLALWRLAVC